MSASQPVRRPSRSWSGPRRRFGSVLLAAVAAALAGCSGSGSGQGGSAFVFLSVERFSLSGTTPVAVVNSFLNDDGVTTAACATLRNDPKSPAAPAPNSLDNVVIRSYTVSFGRPDGGDVPGPFTFNTAVLVPAGTAGDTATLVVVLVPAQAKREPPLRPFPQLPLFATANVVFEGRDGRGQRVETEGAVSVVFQADGTDTVPTC